MVSYTPGGSPIFGGFDDGDDQFRRRRSRNHIVKCPHGCGASMPKNNLKNHRCHKAKPEVEVDDPLHPRNL